jgi:List-Bact-rpt repeat protein
MKRLLFSCLAMWALAPAAPAATNSFIVPLGTTQAYTNNGTITTAPVINALNFINYGTFNIVTVLPNIPAPFETFDTLNFTNFGTMLGINGWRFNFNSTITGKRGMAANFVNMNGGIIQSIDPPAQGIFTFAECAVSAVDPSYLLIAATNIVTGGGTPSGGASMIVGVNGLMEVFGKNVDLSNSGLEVQPASLSSVGTVVFGDTRTNFLPDVAIYDNYWSTTNFSDNYLLNQQVLWDGTTAIGQGVPSPPNAPALTPAPAIVLNNPYANSYTVFQDLVGVAVTNDQNAVEVVILMSNITKGAVFVGVPPGYTVGSSFVGSPQANNPFQGFTVGVTTELPNPVTGTTDTEGIFFQDELASDTRLRGLSENILYCQSPVTFRPAAYAMALLGVPFPGLPPQIPPPEFLISSGNNLFAVDPPSIVDIIPDDDPNPADNIDPSDTVTNFVLNAGTFAAYSAAVDNIASIPPALPGSTISNAPGRVLINATDNLNLEGARIRGEGLVRISTPHLISSTGAVINVENLSLNLGSRTGNLRVQSIVPPGVVSRLRGTVRAWSATWSNTVAVTLRSFSTDDTVDPPVVTETPVVVTLSVNYNCLMLDCGQLTTLVPVNVYNLSLHSRDTIVDDAMNVIESLFVDGRSFTLNGRITVPGVAPANRLVPISILRDWIWTNAPSLLDFTNNGILSIANEGHFGDDRPPYSSFVNSAAGTLDANGVSVSAGHFENHGSLFSGSGLFVQCRQGTFDGGSSSGATFTRFSGRDLKFNNHQVNAGDGPLFFFATNSLADAGEGSANTFQTSDGFNLMTKPPIGDLLGTTFQETAPNIVNPPPITHAWAGEDRGATPAGFQNNTAIGRLALSTLTTKPIFSFSGAGAHNGMYVDQLDLSGLTTNFLNEVKVQPNLVLYFASALLPPTFTVPPDTNGIVLQPEEYLDGKLSGRLRWVKDYAGTFSKTAVVVLNTNGTPISIEVNSALRNSQVIDSNGDGIKNGNQGYPINGAPFDVAALDVQLSGNGSVVPNLGGQALIVGAQYQMTAVPADGNGFVDWSGSTNTDSPTIQFVMTNGLSFVANFTFAATPGSYNGLFFEDPPTGVEFDRSGAISITTSKNGKFTGTLQISGKRYSFSGTLDGNGAAIIGVPNTALTLELQVGNDHVTGTVGDGGFLAPLIADRAVFNKKSNPAPFAGNYTLVIPGTGNPGDTTLPHGDGFASVTVDAAGKVQMKGTLGDGTQVSQSSVVSANGQWPFYLPLYSGQGQILGWLTFEGTGGQDISGLVNWIKLANAQAVFYPDGFVLETNVVGSVYDSTEAPVTGFMTGAAVLTGGNLPNDLVAPVTIAPNNVVTGQGTPPKFSLTLDVKKGLFKGSLPNPATGKTIKFTGAILQRQNVGSGLFLGTDQTGKVVLGP